MKNTLCTTCKEIKRVLDEQEYCEICGTKLTTIKTVNGIQVKG